MLKGHMYWQKLTFRKVAYSILGVYVLVTCYTGFHLLNRKLQNEFKQKIIQERIKSLSEIADDPDWNPWGEEFESEQGPLLHHNAPALWDRRQLAGGARDAPAGRRSPLEKPEGNVSEASSSSLSSSQRVVEIWGKAAIGLYLWEHILEGHLDERMDGVWSYGEKVIGPITFRFRTGPGVVPSKIPRGAENVLLVLNGREPSKVKAGRAWLELLATLPRLRSAAVVLLGDERCDNSWIRPYMARGGGLVKVLFLVYDSPEVDNVHVYQWPLGVATYRHFPNVKSSDVPADQGRKYLFNFLGTVYRNSSRETLLHAIGNSSLGHLGFVKPRLEWLPDETEESSREYINILSNSELTLNPVGLNTECYRIYEAMSLGSVPVVEDVVTPGLCGDGKASHVAAARMVAPLRLLKEFHAPVIYVKDWVKEIGPLLKKEAALSDLDKEKRREVVIRWYSDFKLNMRGRLVKVLMSTFFNSNAR